MLLLAVTCVVSLFAAFYLWPPTFFFYAPKYPCQIPHISIHCPFPLLLTLFSQSGMAFAIIDGWSSESSSNGCSLRKPLNQPSAKINCSFLRPSQRFTITSDMHSFRKTFIQRLWCGELGQMQRTSLDIHSLGI